MNFLSLLIPIFGPTLGSLAFKILEAYVFKYANNKESREIITKLAKHFREQGILDVKSRFEIATEQDADLAEKWKNKNEKPE